MSDTVVDSSVMVKWIVPPLAKPWDCPASRQTSPSRMWCMSIFLE
jgi:hypothetical protein